MEGSVGRVVEVSVRGSVGDRGREGEGETRRRVSGG